MSKGKKFDYGKPPISWIPVSAIRGEAYGYLYGGKKYGRNNFKGGIAHTRLLDGVLRHILAIVDGEDIDPESGIPHVYLARCGLGIYDYQRLNHPGLDDRYKPKKRLTKRVK
jgi:hypothetical protein